MPIVKVFQFLADCCRWGISLVDQVQMTRTQWVAMFFAAFVFSLLWCFRGYGSRKHY